MSRVDWLKLVMQYGQRKNRGRQVLLLVVFEAYYLLCKLRGYRARHFLEPLPEVISNNLARKRLLLIWPHLPLSIRLLDRIVPFGNIAHAECVLYTPEAVAAARAAGRRTAVLNTTEGEFKAVSR